ncbi:LacI family transcriptional regulator [Rhodoplanes elegans]|uniref:LacI family transcriptional regulator n=1 Tax=Rhodoplanes elegans TaxID=29408 RepID=A0A327JTP6_9BRAD|nr:tripartite tricarboxylate transporter substrate-binding protein [Rhodoplanes elegans]MBK5961690.1 LacI family transcriptional regulator [Rhodoplanes elegans]RAI29667.1 LacI family transcriptional regulator [Rhodoplanes elegans]
MTPVSSFRPTRRGLLATLAGAAALPLTGALARASAVPTGFPQRPMTLVVPFSPGGPVDVLGRLLAEAFQARSGHAAMVENRTGGAGNIGIDMVRKAAPDGATLLLIPAGNLTINPTLMPNLPFSVEQDFSPVTLLASAPNIIVAAPGLGVSTIADLIAKAKTERISYGSPGVGSQLHLAMELFNDTAGVALAHVPYRGSSQALTDVIGNHIGLVATNLTAALPAIQARSVVALAMTTARRSPLVPEVPTLAEAGVAGIDVTSWYGMLAPKAVPAATRDALAAVTAEVLQTPAVQDKLAAQGLAVTIEGPEVFAARIRRETAVWAEVIRAHRIVSQ